MKKDRCTIYHHRIKKVFYQQPHQCDPIDGSETEEYIFRSRGIFINVYKADDKIATFSVTSLADINLRRTYRAIDSVATGRIPSLFCDNTIPKLLRDSSLITTRLKDDQSNFFDKLCHSNNCRQTTDTKDKSICLIRLKSQQYYISTCTCSLYRLIQLKINLKRSTDLYI